MGNKLFSEVTELTGLPEELIGQELKGLLENKGVAPEQMTMESLREALADYLAELAHHFAGEEGEQLPELESTASEAPSFLPKQ